MTFFFPTLFLILCATKICFISSLFLPKAFLYLHPVGPFFYLHPPSCPYLYFFSNVCYSVMICFFMYHRLLCFILFLTVVCIFLPPKKKEKLRSFSFSYPHICFAQKKNQLVFTRPFALPKPKKNKNVEYQSSCFFVFFGSYRREDLSMNVLNAYVGGNL